MTRIAAIIAIVLSCGCATVRVVEPAATVTVASRPASLSAPREWTHPGDVR